MADAHIGTASAASIISTLLHEEEKYCQYLDLVLSFKHEIKLEKDQDKVKLLFPPLLQEMHALAQKSQKDFRSLAEAQVWSDLQLEQVESLQNLVKEYSIYSTCWSPIQEAQSLIDQYVQHFTPTMLEKLANLGVPDIHRLYQPVTEKVFTFGRLLRDLTFSVSKDNPIFTPLSQIRLLVAEYDSTLSSRRDLENRFRKGQTLLHSFGIPPTVASVFVYKLNVRTKSSQSPDCADTLAKIYLFTDCIVSVQNNSVLKHYLRNDHSGKVVASPRGGGLSIDGDVYYCESLQHVFLQKCAERMDASDLEEVKKLAKRIVISPFSLKETDSGKLVSSYPKENQQRPKKSGKSDLKLGGVSIGHMSNKQTDEKQQDENSFISNFTIARSSTKTKGQLRYKKDTFYFFLGPDALFYVSNENDETAKGYFNVCHFIPRL